MTGMPLLNSYTGTYKKHANYYLIWHGICRIYMNIDAAGFHHAKADFAVWPLADINISVSLF
jgi:hypothetical protein